MPWAEMGRGGQRRHGGVTRRDGGPQRQVLGSLWPPSAACSPPAAAPAGAPASPQSCDPQRRQQQRSVPGGAGQRWGGSGGLHPVIPAHVPSTRSVRMGLVCENITVTLTINAYRLLCLCCVVKELCLLHVFKYDEKVMYEH